MIDREKVICGLLSCKNHRCAECPYNGIPCITGLLSDALALLIEQEPRVLTREEIIKFNDWVWVDYVDYKYAFNGYEYKLDYDSDCDRVEWLNGATDGMEEYGKTWRCWSARPSPEQMRETKWEGEKDE